MTLRSTGTNGRFLSIPHSMEKGPMHRPAVPRRITHCAAPAKPRRQRSTKTKNSSMLEDTQMHGSGSYAQRRRQATIKGRLTSYEAA